MPSSYITQPNIILQSYIYLSPQPSKSILSPIQYPQFLYPPIHIIIPLSSLHFPPFLPTFIHPPSQLWKCGKLCGKLAYLAYKYPINHRKIPINAPEIVSEYLTCFLISCSLDILYGFYYEFLSVSDLLCPLYIGNPWFPYPPLPEKTFSLFSSSPHFVRVAVKPFFIYRTYGSQMKKPTSSCGHFGKVLGKGERCVCNC